jgi:hypothetical protein
MEVDHEENQAHVDSENMSPIYVVENSHSAVQFDVRVSAKITLFNGRVVR